MKYNLKFFNNNFSSSENLSLNVSSVPNSSIISDVSNEKISSNVDGLSSSSESPSSETPLSLSESDIRKIINSEFSRQLTALETSFTDKLISINNRNNLSPEEQNNHDKLELSKENTKLRNEVNRMNIFNSLSEIASQKQIPITFVKNLISDTLDESIENLNRFDTEYKSEINKAVQSKLSLSSYIPPSGSSFSEDPFIKSLYSDSSVKKPNNIV
jgi:hypothetical protein